MVELIELTKETASVWLRSGAIKLDHVGCERLYFIDDFGRTYYLDDLTLPVSVYDTCRVLDHQA